MSMCQLESAFLGKNNRGLNLQSMRSIPMLRVFPPPLSEGIFLHRTPSVLKSSLSRSRRNLEHPLDGQPGAGNQLGTEFHRRGALQHAIVQFFERVHLHEPALVASAVL